MTNHPNRGKTSYTAFRSQDSSIRETGLTLSEARAVADEGNKHCSANRLAWEIMSDADFERLQSHDVDYGPSLKCRIVDGITKIES
jgi:hypothetical protein